MVQSIVMQYGQVQSWCEHIGESGLARAGRPIEQNGQRRSIRHRGTVSQRGSHMSPTDGWRSPSWCRSRASLLWVAFLQVDELSRSEARSETTGHHRSHICVEILFPDEPPFRQLTRL